MNIGSLISISLSNSVGLGCISVGSSGLGIKDLMKVIQLEMVV